MYTQIKLDKSRTLRYTVRSLSRLEEEMDKPLVGMNFDEIRIKDITTILWAGLLHEDPTITVDEVMDILDNHEIKLDYVAEKVGKAISDSFAENKNPKKAVVER